MNPALQALAEFAAHAPEWVGDPDDPKADARRKEYLTHWAQNRVLAGDIEGLDGDAINALTRSCLQAKKDHTFVIVDFSSVEARVNAWGANDLDALAVFVHPTNNDPYRTLATKVFNLAYELIKKESRERDLCKRLELGCGYGMGGEKFYLTSINPKMGKPVDWPAMVPLFAERTGEFWVRTNTDPRTGKTKPCPWGRPGDPAWAMVTCEMLVQDGWRAAHQPIVQYWRDLEDAAIGAVCGEPSDVGPTHWELVDDALWCFMVSDRPIIYRKPKLSKETRWSEKKQRHYEATALTYQTIKGKEYLYGGKICENVTQAISRDLTGRAIVQCERAGLPVVLHVHDEIVTEVPRSVAKDALALQEEIMKDVPAWAPGLPINVEGFVCPFYRK